MTQPIPLGPGDELRVRMPSSDERLRYDLDESEPMLKIYRQDGTVETFGAYKVHLLAQGTSAHSADSPHSSPA
jgi:hypothetical protein